MISILTNYVNKFILIWNVWTVQILQSTYVYCWQKCIYFMFRKLKTFVNSQHKFLTLENWPLSANSITASLACTSITTRAPRVVRACFVSLPRTSSTISPSCFCSTFQYSFSPVGAARMASCTSRVQYACDAHNTTWPGQSMTQFVLGSMAYAYNQNI